VKEVAAVDLKPRNFTRDQLWDGLASPLDRVHPKLRPKQMGNAANAEESTEQFSFWRQCWHGPEQVGKHAPLIYRFRECRQHGHATK
jgi:hypothetical protein